MSKFCALKSAGMGNRLKIYVSYLARYDEVMVEKEEDRYLFPDFKPCNREDDIKENPWTHSGWRLLVDQNEEDYIKTDAVTTESGEGFSPESVFQTNDTPYIFLSLDCYNNNHSQTIMSPFQESAFNDTNILAKIPKNNN